MILYLDFDGVLHPDRVYLVEGQPVLKGPGELFQWAPVLEQVLEGLSIDIVLSTSWAHVLGPDKAKAYLPVSLQARVIGAVKRPMTPQIRGDEVLRDVVRRDVPARAWRAVDNDANGWGRWRDQLILTDSERGLGEASIQETLRQALAS